MLTKLNTLREEREEGFTLIELLVVILIIGILAAIAIPVFMNQRKAANDSATQSDVKNATTAVETWIISQGATEAPVPAVEALDIKITDGVTLVLTGTSMGYCITGTHENGDVASTTGYVYASNDGGIRSDGSSCSAGYFGAASSETPTETTAPAETVIFQVTNGTNSGDVQASAAHNGYGSVTFTFTSTTSSTGLTGNLEAQAIYYCGTTQVGTDGFFGDMTDGNGWGDTMAIPTNAGCVVDGVAITSSGAASALDVTGTSPIITITGTM